MATNGALTLNPSSLNRPIPPHTSTATNPESGDGNPDECDKAGADLASERSEHVVLRPRRHAVAQSAFGRRNPGGVGFIAAVPEVQALQMALLQSLSLSGSEIVDLPIGVNELNRGHTAWNDELSLSDLLNFKIKWTSRPEKIETDLSNETLNLPKLPDLVGVNLDNFVFKGNKDGASSSFEELFGSNTQITTEGERRF
ncbi:hypothetical protein COP2_037634 [Malus domestica]